MKKCFAKILLLSIFLFIVCAPFGNVLNAQIQSSLNPSAATANQATQQQAQAQNQANVPAQSTTAGPNQYELNDSMTNVDYWTQRIMQFFLKTWLQVITGLMAVAGWMFDQITGFAIDNNKFASTCPANQPGCLGPVISTLWSFVRDIGNIVIVFSLLYLAIRTIIEGDGFADKKKLTGVLLAAILINFSLLFTKAAFTISNSIAVEIKNQITFVGEAPLSGGVADTSGPAATNKTSLSEGIARTLGIPKTINYISDESLGTNRNLNDYQGIQFQYMLMLTFSVVGVGFILLAGALMLLYRFVMFIFLMILAPIGLACFLIPFLKKYGDQWVDKVKGLTLLAPVYFLSFYISMMLLSQIVALGTVPTGGFVGVLVQMATQVILIVGTLLATIMLPVKVAAAGNEFISNVGKWTDGKIRSMPRFAGRQAGRLAAGGAARTGRLAGVGAAGLMSGGFTFNKDKRKANLEELQRLARDGNAVQRAYAKSRLGTAEGLKNRTYDLRNVGGFGKKMGIGDGIKNWDDTVKAKKEKLEKKQKEEMKRYGYDKAGDNPVERQKLEEKTALRDNGVQDVKQKQQAFNTAMASGNVAAQQAARINLELAKADLKNAELQLGMQKNIGMRKHFEKMEKKWRNKMTPTRYAALAKMRADMEKKFKEDGKKKKSNNSGGQSGAAAGGTAGGSGGGTP